jgi:hypothetical protein
MMALTVTCARMMMKRMTLKTVRNENARDSKEIDMNEDQRRKLSKEHRRSMKYH